MILEKRSISYTAPRNIWLYHQYPTLTRDMSDILRVMQPYLVWGFPVHTFRWRQSSKASTRHCRRLILFHPTIPFPPKKHFKPHVVIKLFQWKMFGRDILWIHILRFKLCMQLWESIAYFVTWYYSQFTNNVM